LAAKKDQGAGIFGALSFLNYTGMGGNPPLHTGWFTVLHFGALEPPGRAVKFAEEIPPHLGICNVEFLAQEHVLPISKLKADLRRLAELLERSIRTSILDGAKKAGDSIDLDQLPRAPLAWTIFSLRAGWPEKGNDP
jgi:hypothetical protein